MFKFFNNLAMIEDLTEFSFELTSVNLEAFEADGFVQFFDFISDVNVPSFNTQSPIIEEAQDAPIFADTVTIDAQGELTSCCPCVACAGQNEESDFVWVSTTLAQHNKFKFDIHTK